MNEAIRNMIARKSCRKYKTEQIKDEELDTVLKAGTYAPTGMNRQSPVMIAVHDPDTVRKRSRLNASVI